MATRRKLDYSWDAPLRELGPSNSSQISVAGTNVHIGPTPPLDTTMLWIDTGPAGEAFIHVGPTAPADITIPWIDTT